MIKTSDLINFRVSSNHVEVKISKESSCCR